LTGKRKFGVKRGDENPGQPGRGSGARLALLAFFIASATADAQTVLVDTPRCTGQTQPLVTAPSLRVLSANLAHGRGTGFNQMLQNEATARENIRQAAALLEQLDADIVGLQEADAVSRWSGGFDHVLAIAETSGYGCRVHGLHASNRFFEYGTALLSRFEFEKAAIHHFAPTPPAQRKGFVAAQVAWNPGGVLATPRLVTLASVHLDFSSAGNRESQLAEMEEVLAGFPRPLVLLGDFNLDWEAQDGLLRRFADALDLVTWQPDSANFPTYGGDKRLDWILVSSDLAFMEYRVIDDDISDHLPVWAQLRWAGEQEENTR
jgi:endonuclease/exonuclease/phosphatase family metal-dependent hydrolase